MTGEDKQVDFTTKTGNQDFYDDYYLDDDALQKIIMEVFYHEVVLDTTTHTP